MVQKAFYERKDSQYGKSKKSLSLKIFREINFRCDFIKSRFHGIFVKDGESKIHAIATLCDIEPRKLEFTLLLHHTVFKNQQITLTLKIIT